MKKSYITPDVKCKKVKHLLLTVSPSDITVDPTEETPSMDAKENSIFDCALINDDEE